MMWLHAPRCPGCGWLFYRPLEQHSRIYCRACEDIIPPAPVEKRANG